ncbi:LuxR family transcriptional regulator [Streptomyces sp. Ru62]|uniref:helix-turn-helix transcriptional regulator n=1 Tax=Streptomyces sp. Ru62 TaxID=2080745 RepID=UPI000CDDB072|nr:LuxR family transcriptional regulator [Streptomyces sp. Ru62]POX64359.1 LuxR family transcriptional regulator [Streptomyces sp. Ru62]
MTDQEAPTARLFGRDAELRALEAFSARAGREGAVLLLSGEAGVGKSVLLDAVVAGAQAAGTRVIRATGVQFEADVSYAVLNQLLLPLAAGFAHLGEEERNALMVALGLLSGRVPDRTVIATACLDVLRHEAEQRPLLLVVDDLPWIDRPTTIVLEHLAHHLSGSRIGLLTASRTGEDSYFDAGGLPALHVEPVDDGAADELLRTAFPEMALRVRRRILTEARGNPLALLELAEALDPTQLSAREALPEVLPLTEAIEALFASRIKQLPEPTRDALLLAALEGSGDLGLLRRTATADGGTTALVPAETAKLIEIDEAAGRVVFRHPLVRSAVVESSTNVERRRVHRRLADFFTRDTERRAWHLAESAVEPDEAVAALLEEAARRKLHRGDAGGAIASLTRAAHLSPRAADRGRRLAEAAYLGADVTGELGTASRLLDQARSFDPSLGGSLHAAAAAAFILVNGDGIVDTAHRLVVSAIENGDHGYDAANTDLTDALYTLLLICWWAGREEFWAPLFDAIDRLVPEPPEIILLMSKAFPDTARATAGTRRRLAALIDRQSTETDPASLVRVNTSAVYMDLLGGCRAGAWRLIMSGRAGGTVRSSLACLMHLCLDDFATGRWEEGQRLADEGLALAKTHGYDFISYYFLFHEALLAAVRGEDTVMHQWADELTRVTTQRRAYGAARFAHHARTLGAIGRGDFEAAFHHACDLSPAGTLAPYTPHALWVALDLVEAALRTNRREQAEAHVRAMCEAALWDVSPRLGMLTLAARALVASDAEAPGLFEEAIGGPGARDWPFDYARVRLLYGERLRRARAPIEARLHLNAALEIFEGLGAAPWTARTVTELRAAGQAQPNPAVPAAAAAGLTAQETEIALLAAEGLTNKQIGERLLLSPRTVGSHLYRIFPKLGITSRAALRDALSR